MKLFILLLTTSFLTLAHAEEKPKKYPTSFETSAGTGVFVDFQQATYDIEYDLKTKKSKVVATIKFDMPKEGMPIFDSVTTPTSVHLNGERVNEEETKTPDQETKVRVIQKQLSPGIHTMKIEVPMEQEFHGRLLNIDENGVQNFFSLSDHEDRNFLELYIPANLEYDQVKMDFNINFKNSKTKHKIQANGKTTTSPDGSIHISYPDHFTSSSLFFHVIPENQMEEMKLTVKSVDGRNIPVIAYYTKSDEEASNEMLKKTLKLATQTLHELENDFGAFLHNSLIIYNPGEEIGSMEYCGATISSLEALRHEIIHSYFGRGVMPSEGNAAWLDEAITTWATGGYKKRYHLDEADARGLASQPEYTRHHHLGGYSQGNAFMEYLHGKLESKGGLKPFLKDLVAKKKLKTITTEEFIQEMNKFYGESFDEDFKKHVYAPEIHTHR